MSFVNALISSSPISKNPFLYFLSNICITSIIQLWTIIPTHSKVNTIYTIPIHSTICFIHLTNHLHMKLKNKGKRITSSPDEVIYLNPHAFFGFLQFGASTRFPLLIRLHVFGEIGLPSRITFKRHRGTRFPLSSKSHIFYLHILKNLVFYFHFVSFSTCCIISLYTEFRNNTLAPFEIRISHVEL